VPLMNVFDWFNSSLQVSKDWRTTVSFLDNIKNSSR
jgi:hypothetical protein